MPGSCSAAATSDLSTFIVALSPKQWWKVLCPPSPWCRLVNVGCRLALIMARDVVGDRALLSIAFCMRGVDLLGVSELR